MPGRCIYVPVTNPVVYAPAVQDESDIVMDFYFPHSLQDRKSPGAFTAKLPGTGGKTYDRFGILQRAGADVPRLTGDGALLEGQGTNKCTCVKYNPQGLTNISVSGDAAATLSVVDDSVPLTLHGFGKFGSNVYKLDNSLGTSTAFARVQGGTGNTNIHIPSCVARVETGTATLRLDGTGLGSISFSDNYYARRISGQMVPTASNLLILLVQPGTVAYFTLPQLEESPYCTSIIVGDNSATAVTRASEHATADGSNGYTLDLGTINPFAAAVLRGERVGTIVAKVKMRAAHPSAQVQIINDTTSIFRGLSFNVVGGVNWSGDIGSAGIARAKFTSGETILLGATFSSAGITKTFVSQPDNSITSSASTTVGTRTSMTRLGLCVGSVVVPMSFSRLLVCDRELSQAELLTLYSQWMWGVM